MLFYNFFNRWHFWTTPTRRLTWTKSRKDLPCWTLSSTTSRSGNGNTLAWCSTTPAGPCPRVTHLTSCDGSILKNWFGDRSDPLPGPEPERLTKANTTLLSSLESNFMSQVKLLNKLQIYCSNRCDIFWGFSGHRPRNWTFVHLTILLLLNCTSTFKIPTCLLFRL